MLFLPIPAASHHISQQIDSLFSRITLRYPSGCTVYVARPTRSIPPCCVRDTPPDNLLQLTCRIGAIVCQGPALPLFLGWPRTFGQSAKQTPSFDVANHSLQSAFLIAYFSVLDLPTS